MPVVNLVSISFQNFAFYNSQQQHALADMFVPCDIGRYALVILAVFVVLYIPLLLPACLPAHMPSYMELHDSVSHSNSPLTLCSPSFSSIFSVTCVMS